MSEYQPRRGVRVPSFADMVDVRDALRAKDFHLRTDLYPRDGTVALGELEDRVSGLVGIEPGNLLLYGTGMSAVVDALEVRRPTEGTTILIGDQLYSKAKKYAADELRGRGVRIIGADSGSIEDIEDKFNRFRPDIVLFETISNGLEMPVLDIERFLGLDVVRKQKPLVILDHTLPTASLFPLSGVLEAHSDNLVVVESGTKFYGLNYEMAGLAYTLDRRLLTELQDRRQMVGSLLSASSVETIARILPSKDDFDLRNRRIAANTYRLAVACAEGLEGSDKFIVTHPALSDHPNSKYVQETYLEGGAPVFYIQLGDAVLDGTEQGHYILADALHKNPDIARSVHLRQSFGFDETTMWPDSSAPALRIAGGTEEDAEIIQLEEAYRETLVRAADKKIYVNGIEKRLEIFNLGGREVQVIAQKGEEDCGQALLKMWGFEDHQLPQGRPVNTFDLEVTFDGKEVPLERMLDGNPKMVLGTKRDTGNPHWFAVADGKVINPEGGQIEDRDSYLREKIGEVIVVYEVPFANKEEQMV